MENNLSDLQSLLERLMGATGPDREIECDISIALGLWTPPRGAERDPDRPDVWRREGLNYYHQFADVTASIDAALGLVEARLPGARVCITHAPSNYSGVEILAGRNRSTLHLGGDERADGETALCICASLLQALIASKSPSETGE